MWTLRDRRKKGGLEAWDQFKVSPPAKTGAQSDEMVDTRWVLAWR